MGGALGFGIAFIFAIIVGVLVSKGYTRQALVKKNGLNVEGMKPVHTFEYNGKTYDYDIYYNLCEHKMQTMYTKDLEDGLEQMESEELSAFDKIWLKARKDILKKREEEKERKLL